MGSGRSHARQQDVQSRTNPAFSLSSAAPFREHFRAFSFPTCLYSVQLFPWVLECFSHRACPGDALWRDFAPLMSMYVLDPYHKYLHCHSVLSVLHSIRAAPNPGNIIAQTSSCSAVQLLPKGGCLWLNQDQTNPPRHKVVMRASNP